MPEEELCRMYSLTAAKIARADCSCVKLPIIPVPSSGIAIVFIPCFEKYERIKNYNKTILIPIIIDVKDMSFLITPCWIKFSLKRLLIILLLRDKCY